MRYAIEYPKNTRIVIIHFEKNVPRWSSFDNKSHKLSDLINAIPGVCSSHADNYSVTIERGGVFKWEEVVDSVMKIMSDYFKCKDMKQVTAFVND